MSNLPKGWELVQFDKVCDIRDGTHDSPKYIENGVPFITSKHLTDNGIDFTETNYISEENHIEFSKRSKVDNGDILFGMIGTIGKPVIVNTDFEFSIKNVALLKLSSNELLSNIYVLNLLKSNIIINQFLKLSNGGVQSFIALGMIRKLKIPLPPIEEQKKIADILSTVDKKIAFVEENINATEELKKALMQKLLTEGIGHTEFKDSELGRIPQSWEVVKFKEITKVRQGLQIPISKRKKEKCENCYEYITIQFIKNNKEVEYIENPQKTVICTENDILMTRTGNTGIVVTNVKGVFHNNFFLIDFDRNEISKEYLVYYLNSNSIQKEILLRAGATTIPDLNHGDFYSIKFISPPLEEQKQIAEILSTVDNKLENLKEKKQSFEELKKGLMQKLLTGEVRV
ncbi:restriction endonuclease subunit S [Aliarcobacter sp. ERUVET-7]|jgi:type I restriction enzyme, S subunit|uniref:restriction endonuclease subunit S n=1 Tax=Aliarcobacter sp. ERUVET-7 TaxID=3429683 RepID=UPI003D6A7258